MCGRFGIATDIEGLLDFFDFDPASIDYVKSYNVAPTNPVLTYGARGANTAEYMRWGLIPFWSTLGEEKLPIAINARAETLATNGMFKDPFQRRRCLVIADGFYEWRRNEDGSTTPFRFGVTNWEPFGFASVWDEWHGPDGPVHSCTIVTTTPNKLIEQVHNRMPVIVPREAYGEWLDRDAHDTAALSRLLTPFPADAMQMYEISSAIGKVKNDTLDLLEPVSQSRLI